MFATVGIVLGALSEPARTAPVAPRDATPFAAPIIQPNANAERAGVLHDGVLTVTLEAKPSLWYLDGPKHPAMTIEAFSEPGKPPLMPGPLLRAPAGTELRLTVRNSLSGPLTLQVPAALRGGPDSMTARDSVVVAPGAVATLITRLEVPGNYIYRGDTLRKRPPVQRFLLGLLGGAIVVDTPGAVSPPHDRVFVIMATSDCRGAVTLDDLRRCRGDGSLHYTINGAPWPSTERIHAAVSDSLRWRVINASGLEHPMHLHGFFFRVDSYSGGANARPAPGQMVVTQLVTPWSAMSITWSPDRPGNWLFHCHTAIHTMVDSLSAAPDDPELRGMAGLVLGTIVAPRAGAVVSGEPVPARHLRLVAERAPGVAGHGHLPISARDSVPLMRFVLEEQGRRTDTHTDLSPELDLMRGEPVAITIVNHLDEPTTVHWHGIEVEDSYMDGVPGFSGEGKRLTPAIAPGDSFVARFTPPRSGTFMYHAHVDDVREQLGGLEGALIVRDRGASSSDDHVFFFKGYPESKGHPLEINGQANPDTVVLRAGRTARLRFMNLSTVGVAPAFLLTARPDSATEMARDTMLVEWRPVAKDGFDLPAAEGTMRPAQQPVAIGETWDFEFTPTSTGRLRLEVRGNGRRTGGAAYLLLIRVPIRVE